MPDTNLQDKELTNKARQQLAPNGVLRAALNLSNFLLVSGKGDDGSYKGVAPDMAAAIAAKLGVDLKQVPYATPSEVSAAANSGVWDISLIGSERARAKMIAFASPYVEIEAGYMVPPGSKLQHCDEVDKAGTRIAVYEGSAYDLWMVANLKNATLVHAKTFDAAFDCFKKDGIEVLASLKEKLLSDREAWPGSRILEGRFMAVQQSIGVTRGNDDAAAFIQQFVEEAKASGAVARLIAVHKVVGLTVSCTATAELRER